MRKRKSLLNQLNKSCLCFQKIHFCSNLKSGNFSGKTKSNIAELKELYPNNDLSYVNKIIAKWQENKFENMGQMLNSL